MMILIAVLFYSYFIQLTRRIQVHLSFSFSLSSLRSFFSLLTVFFFHLENLFVIFTFDFWSRGRFDDCLNCYHTILLCMIENDDFWYVSLFFLVVVELDFRYWRGRTEFSQNEDTQSFHSRRAIRVGYHLRSECFRRFPWAVWWSLWVREFLFIYLIHSVPLRINVEQEIFFFAVSGPLYIIFFFFVFLQTFLFDFVFPCFSFVSPV